MSDLDAEVCENCGYPAPLTEQEGLDYTTRPFSKVTYKFCEVCANTFLGRATSYPQYADGAPLFQSLGYIANMILDEIRKSR